MPRACVLLAWSTPCGGGGGANARRVATRMASTRLVRATGARGANSTSRAGSARARTPVASYMCGGGGGLESGRTRAQEREREAYRDGGAEAEAEAGGGGGTCYVLHVMQRTHSSFHVSSSSSSRTGSGGVTTSGMVADRMRPSTMPGPTPMRVCVCVCVVVVVVAVCVCVCVCVCGVCGGGGGGGGHGGHMLAG